MGFTSGIYKAKRYNNTVTPKTIQSIGQYIMYLHNSWAKEHYQTYEKYSKSYDCFPLPEDKNMLAFYLKEAKLDEFNSYSITEEIETWCSNGGVFDDWLSILVDKKNNGYFGEKELSKDIIIKAIERCTEELNNNRLVPVILQRSYLMDDNDTITSVVCDGIEVIFEDGKLTRLEGDDFDSTEIFACNEGYYDVYSVEALESLRETLIKILCTVDFENEIVFYEGGN